MNKKMTTKEIKDLKARHRLELVMQEAGERFEADANNPDILRGAAGLVVNTRMQTYEITRPGENVESGDVIEWLKSRYSWSFAMVLKYLRKRTPDPIQAEQPKAEKKQRSVPTYTQSDYAVISNYYINPITGEESYGMDFNYSIMDDLQKRALDLWHDAYKYFDKSSDEVWDKVSNYPSRFKPVIDFSIDKCANCETPFTWKEYGAIAYAEEREEFITVCGESEDGKEFSGQLVEADELFIDQDFIICEKCLRSIYAPHYKALRLVYRSARRREKAAEEEHRQIEREQAEEEEREREREQERLEREYEP